MTAEEVAARVAAVLRLAQHLATEAMALRCELTAFPGEANDFEHQENRGRCRNQAVGVRWEDGFADAVCQRHAATAEERGVLVVRPLRHDGATVAAALGAGEGSEAAGLRAAVEAALSVKVDGHTSATFVRHRTTDAGWLTSECECGEYSVPCPHVLREQVAAVRAALAAGEAAGLRAKLVALCGYLDTQAQLQSRAHNVDTAIGIRFALDHARALAARAGGSETNGGEAG